MSQNNPVLSQILAKVVLNPNTLAYREFFDVVPQIKKNGLAKVYVDQIHEYVATANDGEALQPTLTPRIRCWDENRSFLVQLLPDAMIVNKVGADFEWGAFKEFFANNLAALEGVLGELPLSSLALKTVYKFAVARRNYDIEKYLNLGVQGINDWWQYTDESLDFSFASGRLDVDNRNRQLRVLVKPRNGQFYIKIFSVFHDRVLEKNFDLPAWLDRTYHQSALAFQSLLSDQLRSRIVDANGVVPANGKS